MRKKGYKQMQRRLLREIYRRMTAETNLIEAEKEAIWARQQEAELRRRLRNVGANTETVSKDVPGALKIIRREIKPERVATWATVDPLLMDEDMENFMREMAQYIANQIVENDLIQLTVREANEIGGPLEEFASAVLKVFVVPWEQMAKSEDARLELNERIDQGRHET